MKGCVPTRVLVAFALVALGALALRGPRALLYLAPLAVVVWLMRPAEPSAGPRV